MKLGAIAKSTGKAETKVSINVLASNAFREFSRQEEEINEEQDQIEDEQQQEEDGNEEDKLEEDLDETPSKPRQTRKRLGTRKRLVDMFERLKVLRKKVNDNKGQLGTEEYNRQEEIIRKAVTSRFEQYLEQRSFAKQSSLYVNRAPQQKTLAIESETGWQLSPSIEGKVTFSDLRAARDRDDVIKQLGTRNALPEPPHTFNKLKKALQEDERQALEKDDPRAAKTEINERARHFTIRCQGRVFAWLDEM